MTQPDSLKQGAWGGDAHGYDPLTDRLSVPYHEERARAFSQIELGAQQQEAYKRLAAAAADGDEGAAAKLAQVHAILERQRARAAALPKPVIAPIPTSGRNQDMIAGLAEEGVRRQRIEKGQHVIADADTAARVLDSKGQPMVQAEAPAPVVAAPAPPPKPAPKPVRVVAAAAPAPAPAPPDMVIARGVVALTALRREIETGVITGDLTDLEWACSELQRAIRSR
jgi:hypothetical protein